MPTTVKELVAAANAAVPRISPAEAKALHAKGEAVFIDLREPPELAASGTVPGALPIPRGLLEFRADPESPDRNPAFQKPVVITYCASGGSRRSMKTASPLACSAFASAGEMCGTAALAAATSSLTVVGMGLPPDCGPESLAQRIRQDEAEQRRSGHAQHREGQRHAG